MKIVEIRDKAVPIDIRIRNASMSVTQLKFSIVAVVTDVVREGKPVVGFAFASNGRHACNPQIRDRFTPRLLGARPDALLDPQTGLIDPARAVDALMVSESPVGMWNARSASARSKSHCGTRSARSKRSRRTS